MTEGEKIPEVKIAEVAPDAYKQPQEVKVVEQAEVKITEIAPDALKEITNVSPKQKGNLATDNIPPNRKSEPLAANTTEEQQIISAGQRTINLLWENTQAKIALISIYGWMILNAFVIAWMLVSNAEVSAVKIALITAALSSISLTVGIVIGFYFSRTNHTATGGVGPKGTAIKQEER